MKKGILLLILISFVFLACKKKLNNSDSKYLSKVELKNEKPTNPNKTVEWRESRLGSDFDYEKVQQSKKAFNRKLKNQQNQYTRDASINEWIERGPFGIGGRVTSFVVDPMENKHMFAASETGGILETNNGGNTWSQVDDFMASLIISDIEYDPNNNDVLYASTGNFNGQERGVGFFKSTNNGATWTLLPPPMSFSNFRFVNDIELDPNNPNWIYAGVSLPSINGPIGLLYKSIDGGLTWASIGILNSAALSINVDPFDSDHLLIGCLQGLGQSTNAQSANMSVSNIAGSGVNQIPAGVGRIEISFCPNSPEKIYAVLENIGSSNNAFYVSDDSGGKWVPLAASGLGTSATWFTNLVWVDPTNSNRIVTGGVDLYQSLNGGISFSQISDWRDDIGGNDGGGNNSIHADNHMIIPFNNFNGSSNAGVYIANDGGVYSAIDIFNVSTNSGWTSNVGNMAATQCYGGAISPDGKKMIVGSQDNSFSLTTDTGSSWTQPTTGDGSKAAINYNDDNIMYANLNNNSLQKSTNGGNTWNNIARFGHGQNGTGTLDTGWPPCALNSSCISGGVFYADNGASLISPFKMDPNNPKFILASGRSLWKNTESGDANSWTMIKDTIATTGFFSTIQTIEVAKGNSKGIWVSYQNGSIQRTMDDGLSWSANISPFGSSGRPTDICINPNNSSQVIISFGSYGNNNLYLTNNGNDPTPTWTNISTDIEVPATSIAWHPTKQNWIYLGTFFGILASENLGTDWSITPLYSENEGPINTEISELFFQPNSTTLVVVSYGRGMWTSNSLKDKVYVNKNFIGSHQGTFSNPYKSFLTAYNSVGNGSEIVFLGGGNYNEINAELIVKKRLTISGLNSSEAIIE